MTSRLLEALQSCRVYDLEQPRYAGAPTFEAHAPGYLYTLHRRHEPGLGEPRTSASGLIVTADHSGTHIDALCHQAENLRMAGRIEIDAEIQTSRGFTRLGVETIEPMIARCVLLDVPRALGRQRLEVSYPVSADDLEHAAQVCGVEIRPGDVILVRTGNGALWDTPAEYLRGPGLDSKAASWLASKEPFAVGADNVAIDLVGVHDAELGSLPCHTILLVRHGVYLIENLYLEQLAADSVTESTFLCLPLKLRGATGSPVRPLALLSQSSGS